MLFSEKQFTRFQVYPADSNRGVHRPFDCRQNQAKDAYLEERVIWRGCRYPRKSLFFTIGLSPVGVIFTGVLLLSSWAFSDPVSLTLSQVNAPMEGDQVRLPIVMTAPAGQQVAALQFDVEYDPDALTPLKKDGVVIGNSAKAAGKQINFSPLTTGKLHILVVGFNQEVIANGEILVLTFTLHRPNMLALQPVRLRDVLLADPTGTKIPVTAQDGGVHLLGAPIANENTGGLITAERFISLLCLVCALIGLAGVFWQIQRRRKKDLSSPHGHGKLSPAVKRHIPVS